MSTHNMTTGAATVRIGALVCLPAFIVMQSYVLLTLWNWYAPAPLTQITFMGAMGLDVLIVCMKGYAPARPRDPSLGEETAYVAFAETFGVQILSPAFVLLMGVIVHAIGGAR